MLWMERVTIIVYCAMNFFIYGFIFLISASMNVNPTWNELKNAFIFTFIATAIIWLMLRAIDFLFAGPLRRELRKGREMNERSNFAKRVN